MLTLQFIPYGDMAKLSSASRIRKIMNIVKENKIALMEGRLKANEEAELIQRTMEDVNKDFPGIELCTIYNESKSTLLEIIKRKMIDTIIGSRQGFTIIGPASIVKEIKRDPNKIQLFTNNIKTRRKRRR